MPASEYLAALSSRLSSARRSSSGSHSIARSRRRRACSSVRLGMPRREPLRPARSASSPTLVGSRSIVACSPSSRAVVRMSLDQLIDLVEIGADVGEHVLGGDRILGGELERDADPRERRAQLVRDVAPSAGAARGSPRPCDRPSRRTRGRRRRARRRGAASRARRCRRRRTGAPRSRAASSGCASRRENHSDAAPTTTQDHRAERQHVAPREARAGSARRRRSACRRRCARRSGASRAPTSRSRSARVLARRSARRAAARRSMRTSLPLGVEQRQLAAQPRLDPRHAPRSSFARVLQRPALDHVLDAARPAARGSAAPRDVARQDRAAPTMIAIDSAAANA